MTITIDRDTFTVTGREPRQWNNEMVDIGTVEIVVNCRRMTVDARRYEDGSIFVRGFVGRYITSTKPWRASVAFYPGKDSDPYVHFGRDDRSGRFNKSRMIRYEPETYANV